MASRKGAGEGWEEGQVRPGRALGATPGPGAVFWKEEVAEVVSRRGTGTGTGVGVGSMVVSVVSTAAGGRRGGGARAGKGAGPAEQPAASILTQDSGRLK